MKPLTINTPKIFKEYCKLLIPESRYSTGFEPAILVDHLEKQVSFLHQRPVSSFCPFHLHFRLVQAHPGNFKIRIISYS